MHYLCKATLTLDDCRVLYAEIESLKAEIERHINAREPTKAQPAVVRLKNLAFLARAAARRARRREIKLL